MVLLSLRWLQFAGGGVSCVRHGSMTAIADVNKM